MKSASKGFTLIEILVVMVLISITGSMVFINFGKNQDHLENKGFAEKMISMCKKTRQRALVLGEPSVFKISSFDRRCWMENTEKYLEIPKAILIEGEGIAQADEDTYSVTFFPDGSSSGGEFVLLVNGQILYEFRIDMLTGILEIMNDKG
jgi:general secretion pathway protein H